MPDEWTFPDVAISPPCTNFLPLYDPRFMDSLFLSAQRVRFLPSLLFVTMHCIFHVYLLIL